MSLLGKLFGRFRHTSRGLKQDRKRKSHQPWEVAYRRRKAGTVLSRKRKGNSRFKAVRRRGRKTYVLRKPYSR